MLVVIIGLFHLNMHFQSQQGVATYTKQWFYLALGKTNVDHGVHELSGAHNHP
jgi:hypothetical protein